MFVLAKNLQNKLNKIQNIEKIEYWEPPNKRIRRRKRRNVAIATLCKKRTIFGKLS